MQPSEVLTEAKRRLLEDGWIRGRYQDENGLCSAGAVLVTEGLPLHWTEDWQGNTSLEILQELINWRGLGFWNDDPRTSFGDVMELFDKAIILAKSREAGIE